MILHASADHNLCEHIIVSHIIDVPYIQYIIINASQGGKQSRSDFNTIFLLPSKNLKCHYHVQYGTTDLDLTQYPGASDLDLTQYLGASDLDLTHVVIDLDLAQYPGASDLHKQ